MKHKKILAFVLVVGVMLSLPGIFPVFAADAPLLFDMNLSCFSKGEAGDNWGITNDGTASNAVIEANDGLDSDGSTPTGEITKASFINMKGETVDYLRIEQYVNDSAARTADINLNSRLRVEDSSWAGKKLTAEFWIKIEEPDALAYILNVFGDDDDDRKSVSRRATLGVTPESKWDFRAGPTSTGAYNSVQSAENFPDSSKWVHVAIVKDLGSANPPIIKGYCYIDGVSISTNMNAKSLAETVSGIIIGNISTTKVDTSPEFCIASAKVYEGALNAEQIATHYEQEMQNYIPLLGSVEAYADSESFEVNLSEWISDDALIDSEECSLSLSEETQASVFSYDLSSKVLTVTPNDYLISGKEYILFPGGSLGGALRVEVKPSKIKTEAEYSDGTISYYLTGDGNEHDIKVLAVGYADSGELMEGATFADVVLTGTEKIPYTMDASTLSGCAKIKLFIWEVCTGYIKPIADTTELEIS